MQKNRTTPGVRDKSRAMASWTKHSAELSHGAVHLITGGCRSGKSEYAEKLAESISDSRTYIATCPIIEGDDEMADRIARHKTMRAGKGWLTIEEPVLLAEAIKNSDPDAVVLVDCLTLWINNLLFEAEKQHIDLNESEIVKRCSKLKAACRTRTSATIFVTNEVGMGIVPVDPMTRLYRDLVGRCNQCVAAFSDYVVLLASGLPLSLKHP